MIATPDITWAAGFLEGEGSFGCPRTSPQIQAAQVNREPLDRLASIFGGKVYACRARGNGRPYFMWSMVGTRAASVMMTIAGQMSARRFGQIAAALLPWKAAGAGKGAQGRAQTHCRHGHPLSGANLTVVSTTAHRRCRECARIAQRKCRAARSN
jgi:hypothetical protein